MKILMSQYKHRSPLYALFYYTDCQIATLDYFVWKKGSAKNETRRHYGIARDMLLVCQQFITAASSMDEEALFVDALADLKRRFERVEAEYHKTPAGQE